MTPEEHQARHQELHKSFDELLACFIASRKQLSTIAALEATEQDITPLPLSYTLRDFLHWGYEMTLRPSYANDIHPDPRGPADFEEERTTILLALVCLAGMRPERLDAIKRIYERFGAEYQDTEYEDTLQG